MSGYLLDTVTLSELRRPELNQPVQRWLENHGDSDLYLSVMTFGELRKGIERLPQGIRKSELEVWYASIITRYADFILDIDIRIARRWGEMLAPFRSAGLAEPTVDALIAATAIVHNLVIVTRNVSDFEEFGAATVNPWEGEA